MRASLLILLLTVSFATISTAQATRQADPVPLRVLYVGPMDTARGRGYLELLRHEFTRAIGLNHSSVTKAALDGADVVVLDRPPGSGTAEQALDGPGASVLGPRTTWTLPLVVLGAEVIAQTARWRIKGYWG